VDRLYPLGEAVASPRLKPGQRGRYALRVVAAEVRCPDTPRQSNQSRVLPFTGYQRRSLG